MSKKTGKLTDEEIEIINSLKDSMTAEQIAASLNRRTSIVSDYINQNIGATKVQVNSQEAKHHLKGKPFYKVLQQQFNDDELKMFEFHYSNMYAQFKEDVFHTEEMQIIDICRLEILCDRILKAQGETRKKIMDLETAVSFEKTKPVTARDINFIQSSERQIAAMQIGLKTMSEEYRDFMTRKSSMFKDIKGTRDQRIKIFEDSKTTWTSLVKALNEDHSFRKEIGIEMEKYRIAAEKERQRLKQEIVYEDGIVDSPLLSPD